MNALKTFVANRFPAELEFLRFPPTAALLSSFDDMCQRLSLNQASLTYYWYKILYQAIFPLKSFTRAHVRFNYNLQNIRSLEIDKSY